MLIRAHSSRNEDEGPFRAWENVTRMLVRYRDTNRFISSQRGTMLRKKSIMLLHHARRRFFLDAWDRDLYWHFSKNGGSREGSIRASRWVANGRTRRKSRLCCGYWLVDGFVQVMGPRLVGIVSRRSRVSKASVQRQYDNTKLSVGTYPLVLVSGKPRPRPRYPDWPT